MGDRAPAKATRIGDSDSVRFSDCEYIEGMTLTHHLNQIKLSAFVAIDLLTEYLLVNRIFLLL